MTSMSNLAIQPLYDKIGATYDATRRAEPAILDLLAALLDLTNGADVLDIGCGTGNYTTALGERGYEMLGLDHSGLMLRTARAKAPGLPLIGADAANLPFANRSFDGAICTLAIHHFDDLEASFAEAAAPGSSRRTPGSRSSTPTRGRCGRRHGRAGSGRECRAG